MISHKAGILIFGFFCLLFLTSCAEPDRSSINFGLNTAPVTLDPRYTTDAVSYRLSRLIYKSLVDFDERFQVVADLAKWERLAPDHYRFYLLDKNRTFHDGSRLTASDVRKTYETVLDKKNSSPHRSSVRMIDAIELIDDDTIDFKLSYDDPLFPGRLVIGIMPATLIANGHDFNRQPVGSGPLRFSGWQDDERIDLLRLKDDQRFKFITLKDPTVRVLKLLRGEIDLLQGNIPPEVVRWLEQKQSIIVKRKQGNTFTYIGFNLEDKTTANRNVRRAVAHAIDRRSIINYVMDETARMAGAILPPNHWAGHPSLTGIAFNPDEAMRLLKREGYDENNRLSLVYKTSNNPFRLRLATIIQHQLRNVGIDMDIRSYDWGTFYGDIKAGRFQLYSLSWVGLNMPDIFRYVFHSASVPPHGANRGRFIDAGVDLLIEAAESEMSLIKQADYYRQLQQYLLESIPYVPLWYEDNVSAMRDDIKGYEPDLDGNFDSLNNVTRIMH